MKERTQRFLNFFINDPMGEEILEGTLGGTVAGLSQIGSDNTPEEIALKTLGGIGGGIGIGMAGRRIGANIGKRIHADPLKDQQGMLATVSRTLGSKTTVEGLQQQGQIAKNAVQQGLIENTSADLIQEALINPEKFYKSYGIPAEQFKELEPLVKQGQMAAQVSKIYKGLGPEQKKEFTNKVLSGYKDVENLITQKAAGSIDEQILKMQDTVKRVKNTNNPNINNTEKQVMNQIDDFMKGLTEESSPVTGENVGRAIGRALGDEIGILGGMGTAGLLANQIGLVSPKDKKIKMLEKQISQLRTG